MRAPQPVEALQSITPDDALEADLRALGRRALGTVAVAPLWLYPLARRIIPPAESFPNLGAWLDRAAATGWIEVLQDQDRFSWTIKLQAPGTSTKRPRSSELAALIERARRNGLLANADTSVPTEEVLSGPPAADSTPQLLEASTVVLRTEGLRFWSAQPVPPCLCRVAFHATDERESALATYAAIVVASAGDPWSGYEVTVLFTGAQASSTDDFLASALYARFAMPQDARERFLTCLNHRDDEVGKLSGEVARNIAGFRDDNALPESLHLWSDVANRASEGPYVIGPWLEQEVNRRTARGDALRPYEPSEIETPAARYEAAEKTGEAQALLDAAKFVDRILGGVLTVHIGLAERRLEHAYRRNVDRFLLRSFLKRQEPLDAFEQLLDLQTPDWGLHYIGVGGVGKTMLLRYLTSVELPRRRLPFSRVDFDFLSADYPVRQPGRLLLELGDALRPFGRGSATDDLFQKFRDNAIALHQRLASEPPSHDPFASLKVREFDFLLTIFCEFIASLEMQPAILILDTCEELARLRAGIGFQPAVEATFRILEAVQDRLKGRGAIRVIFAGRRLLALAGTDWETSDYRIPERRAHFQPLDSTVPPEQFDPRRAWLKLHLLRGFDTREANHFLRGIKLPQASAPREMSGEMEHAILQRSIEAGVSAHIHWTGEAAGRVTMAGEGDHRYNPFDLALYADWFLDDPRLDVATVTTGRTDPYVEMRIVQRLRHRAVTAALPYLVWLQRCEKELLREVLPVDPSQFDEVYRELCQLEWLDYQPDENLGTAFLEVDRDLQSRLVSYFESDAQRAAFARARQRLARVLPVTVREMTPERPIPDYIHAAFRVLEGAAAGALWADLELRLCNEGDWRKVYDLCDRLLATERGVAPEIVAHVQATQIGAMVRVRPDFNLEAEWEQVRQGASKHPDPEIARWLMDRAACGLITARARKGQSPGADEIAALEAAAITHTPTETTDASQWRAEQKLASIVAALDAIVELAESEDPSPAPPPPAAPSANAAAPNVAQPGSENGFVRLALLTGAFPDLQACPDISLWLLTLNLRLVRLAESRARVVDLQASHPLLASRGELPHPELSRTVRWLDWDRPRHLLLRVALHLRPFAAKLPWTFDDAPDSRWSREASEQVADVDGDRLLSAIIQSRLTREVIRAAELRRWSSDRSLFTAKVPACGEHRRTPALFISLAMAWAAQGEARSALDLLNQGRRTPGVDALSVRLADDAKLRICRRMRLEGRADALLAEKTRSEDAHEVGLAWPLLRLRGPVGTSLPALPEQAEPAIVAAWWRNQEFMTEAGRRAGRAMPEAVLNAAAEKATASPTLARELLMFRFERQLLDKNHKVWPALIDEVLERLWTPGAREAGESRWQARLWLAVVRAHRRALETEDDAVLFNARYWQECEDELLPLVGCRRLAEWALEQGELQALRYPDLGALMLEAACYFFEKCGDTVGAFIAGVAAAIAHIHAGNTSEGIVWLRDHEKRYRAMAEPRAAVLPREIDFRKPLEASEKLRPAVDDASWGPWLRRLDRCLQFSGARAGGLAPVRKPASERPAEANARSQASVHTWAKDAQRETDPPELVLVPELLTVAGPARSARRFLRIAQTLGTFGLGLSVIWFVLWTAGKGFEWIARTGWGQEEISGFKQLLGGGFLLCVLGALIWTIRKATGDLISRFAAASQMRLQLRRQAGNSGELHIALEHSRLFRPESDSKRALFRLLVDLRLFARTRTDIQGTWSPRILPPSADDPPMPQGLIEPLKQWGVWLNRRRLRIAIECDPEIARLPWEETLLQALGPYRRNFLPYRWSPPLPSRTRPPGLPPHTVSVICPRRWHALSACWTEVKKPHRWTMTMSSGAIDTLRFSDIVHLIGRPVPTNAGIRLKVESGAELQQRFTRNKSVSEDDAAETLVGADQLPLADGSIIIVQAEPAEFERRTETDREQILQLRQLASELFMGGAAAVILVPTLQPALAEAVIRTLARGLARAKAGTDPLLREVDAVRALIAAWRSAPSATPDAGTPTPPAPVADESASMQEALAQGVTVFAREELRFLPTNPKPEDQPL